MWGIVLRLRASTPPLTRVLGAKWYSGEESSSDKPEQRKEVRVHAPIFLTATEYGSGQDGWGRALVLHGLLGSRRNWHTMCRAVTEQCQVRLWAGDLRAHGESPPGPPFDLQDLVSDVENWLLGGVPALLIGHSLGGRVVMMTALRSTSIRTNVRPAAIVVVDTSPISFSSTIKHLPKVLERVGSTGGSIRAPTLSEARRQAETLLKPLLPVSPALRALLANNIIVEGPGVYRWGVDVGRVSASLPFLLSFPLEGLLPFQGPTLFLCGADSDFVPRSDEPGIKKLFPSAQMVYIEGAGHLVHVEKPEEFRNALVQFILEKYMPLVEPEE